MCSNGTASTEAINIEVNQSDQQSPLNYLDLNQNQQMQSNFNAKSFSPVQSSSPSTTSSISPAGPPPSIPSINPPLISNVQVLQHQQQTVEFERQQTTFFGLPAGNSNGQMSGLLPLDHYRLQLYNYAMVERLRTSTTHNTNPNTHNIYPPVVPYGSRLALSMSLFHNRVFQPEEPKPQHSYIGLIAMAILSHPDHKLVLSDIYQHILDNYPYFRSRGPGWRNSIRHNLSLNDCFIKAGRSANGKGHYWAIHPANLEDFKKGDFRRRKAQRKVRKHMGLAVDEDGADSPSPPPLTLSPPPHSGILMSNGPHQVYHPQFSGHQWTPQAPINAVAIYSQSTRKRQFDVASLLAPDDDDLDDQNHLTHLHAKRLQLASHHHYHHHHHNHNHHTQEQEDEDIDVVASDDCLNSDLIIDRTSLSPELIQSTSIEHTTERTTERNHDNHPRPSWNTLIQHLPLSMNVVDPRILGRYYGQYMAAAHHHATAAANKRLLSNLSHHHHQQSAAANGNYSPSSPSSNAVGIFQHSDSASAD